MSGPGRVTRVRFRTWSMSYRATGTLFVVCEICINEDLIGFSMSFKVHLMRSYDYLPCV